jgi:hypothetical protein
MINEEDRIQVKKLTDDQLISTILFSDCLGKEYCDLLSEEFDFRKLDWNCLYDVGLENSSLYEK